MRDNMAPVFKLYEKVKIHVKISIKLPKSVLKRLANNSGIK